MSFLFLLQFVPSMYEVCEELINHLIVDNIINLLQSRICSSSFFDRRR